MIDLVGWVWFYKRLSPNETGATGTHQRAITIPRKVARTLFPELSGGANPSLPLPLDISSHAIRHAARVTHWNQGTRDEYHITGLGGRSPLLNPGSTGCVFVLALPPTRGDRAKGWLLTTNDEEKTLRGYVGELGPASGSVHRPSGLASVTRRVAAQSASPEFAGEVPFRTVGEEITEPDPSGTAEAFSQSGYRFELAIADLIDNSIDAKARNVLIRFVTDDDSIREIVVADDGHGMTEPELRHAMQYGARIERHAGDLGKYGVGMKSASLSQCRSLSVLSRRDGETAGRRWTDESIRSGWRCEVLDPTDAGRMLDLPWGPVSMRDSGTLILWNGLDRLRTGRDGVEKVVDGFFKLLNLHLGLVFHRFLAGRRMRLQIDRVDARTWDAGLPATVEPLDPFAYPMSGATGYPQTYALALGDGLEIPVVAHIWPAKSKLAGYRLGGGRVASRQGFYFYRNDRLIQAGGWNGWRESDNEPHLSLARVAVDLPIAADRSFGLSLHKSAIDVPPSFARVLDHAVSTEGVPFHDYVRDALEAYRSANVGPVDREATPIIGPGVPSRIRSRTRRVLASGDLNVRPFRFVWAKLPPDVVVEVDRETDAIRINSVYRRAINGGKRPSANDAPLVKMLLFVALGNHLGRERTSASLRREVSRFNDLLRATLESIPEGK